jgi:hypothetical protein
MSITHVGKSKWRKGVYKPFNPHKYKGGDAIIFRSQWEFRVMRWLDLSENVIEWISEQPLIPYLNPNTGTVWQYHPDFLVRVKTQTGMKTQLIEIKPKKQTIPPVVTEGKRRKTILTEMATWNMNKAKWKAAKSYCDSHGWEFKILTEDDIFG